MNRRSFFQSLAVIGAAVAAPSLFLPRLEKVKWKKARGVYVPNPAYQTAPFEVFFIDMPPLFDEAILAENDKAIFDKDLNVVGYLHERTRMESFFQRPPLLRYKLQEGTGKLVEVFPFIKV